VLQAQNPHLFLQAPIPVVQDTNSYYVCRFGIEQSSLGARWKEGRRKSGLSEKQTVKPG